MAALNSYIFAADAIKCYVPRMNTTIAIDNQKIVFLKPSEHNVERKIASITADNVRSSDIYKSINKHLTHQGLAYSIHIADSANFSEVDDYISIKNKDGHQITYPITCSN